MDRRKAFRLAAAVCLCFVLGGCGQEKAPEISSISIDGEGAITHQIIGEFNQDYYDLDSLNGLAAERVAEHCADYGEGSAVLESVTEEEGRIKILLDYASDRDYSIFNHREMFIGTLLGAEAKGYKLDEVSFVTPDGEAVSYGSIDGQDEKQIVIIATKPSEELLVNTFGNVLYTNRSAADGVRVECTGKKSVHITNPADESGADGAGTLTYIIFN